VFEVASSDLVNMGITVVSYTLKDIRDEEGYLKVHKSTSFFTVFYPLDTPVRFLYVRNKK
jgi:hypothetical protein